MLRKLSFWEKFFFENSHFKLSSLDVESGFISQEAKHTLSNRILWWCFQLW